MALVITFHGIGRPIPGAGIVGVTVFFTLSGFLITSLLLEERHRTGAVRVRAFYGRRARRLLPALAVMLVVVGPLALSTGAVTPGGFAAVVGYAANWYTASGRDLGPFTHTWTLSTEEQFYLLWPVALLLLHRIRFAVAIVLAVAAALLVTGVLGSAVSAIAILVGCALAMWIHGRRGVRPVPRAAVPLLVAGLVAASLIGSVLAAVVVGTVLSAGLIYAMVSSPVPDPWLSSPVARWAGRRSYGLYLWHVPVMYFAPALMVGVDRWVVALTMGSLILAAVELSWRYVEQPFLVGRLAGARGRVTSQRPGLAVQASFVSG